MVSGASTDEVVLMGWYVTPEERERAAYEALKPHWEAMRRDESERAERERVEMEELWEGIGVGDVVEVSEEEHVARGGLLLIDERTGDVKVRQVRVLEVSGRKAKVQDFTQYRGLTVAVTEWMDRDRIKGVVREGIVRHVAGRKYWEQG